MIKEMRDLYSVGRGKPPHIRQSQHIAQYISQLRPYSQ